MIRFQKIIIFIIIISLSAGCTSQKDNSTSNEIVNPTITIRDLHNVKFHLVDQNDTPIYNALITANYNASNYPDSSNAPNNNRGYTDENGNLSFVMRGSIQYNLTISNVRNKQESITSITPIANEYSLKIKPTIEPTPAPTQIDLWDKYRSEDLGYQFIKGVCSFIPYFNDALNC